LKPGSGGPQNHDTHLFLKAVVRAVLIPKSIVKRGWGGTHVFFHNGHHRSYKHSRAFYLRRWTIVKTMFFFFTMVGGFFHNARVERRNITGK
jgi:hypothetical protein